MTLDNPESDDGTTQTANFMLDFTTIAEPKVFPYSEAFAKIEGSPLCEATRFIARPTRG